MKRTAGLVAVALAAVACATMVRVAPAQAGTSGSGGGSLVINTVYNTVVKQNITDVTTNELNATLSHIAGAGTVEIRHDDGASSYHHFAEETTVDASGTMTGLTGMLSTLNGDVFSVPGATAAYRLDGSAIGGHSRGDIEERLAELYRRGRLQTLLESGFQGSHTVWLQPVVSDQLTSTDTSHATSVSVSQTPDAIVIGDPACLVCDLNGTTFVVQGTVTVTDTETTIETQNITRTTTNKYNTVGEYTMSVDRLITAEGECRDGGWRALTDGEGRPFRNQGDCVSYVATDDRNPADGEHQSGPGPDNQHAARPSEQRYETRSGQQGEG